MEYTLKDLRKLVEECKDLPETTPVILYDPDTAWELNPTIGYDGEDNEIYIVADYGDIRK